MSTTLGQKWIGAKQEIFPLPGQAIAFAMNCTTTDETLLAVSYLKSNEGWLDVSKGPARIRIGKGPIYAMTFSPDGSLLATGGKDCFVRLIDVSTGIEVRHHKAHWNFFVDAVAFSPDGNFLYYGVGNNDVRMWNVRTWEEVKKFKVGVGVVNTLTVSPNGQLIAIAGGNGKIYLLDALTGAELGVMQGHTYPLIGIRVGVRQVVFSADSRLLASAGSDKTVRIWDVSTKRELNLLQGHTGGVWSVDFSPDAGLVVSGSDDKTVRLWDVTSGHEIATVAKHKGSVIAVAFCGERKIISVAQDKTSYLLTRAE